MKTTEKILGIIIVLSLVLKIFNIPGNSVLFVFSVSFLVMIYFYLGFALFNEIPLKGIFKKKSYENIHGLRIIGAVFSGMSLSMILAGILFKIQHWPGENTQLASGLVLSAIIILVALSKYIKRKGPFYRRIAHQILYNWCFWNGSAVYTQICHRQIQNEKSPGIY